MVEDLLRAYSDGFAVRDWSLPDGHPNKDFRMRVCLLNWIGDYKGQGKIANMKHQGAKECHWCLQHFRKGLGTTGSCFADNTRRYLPRASPIRNDPDYGNDWPDPADNRPPKNRSHDTIWATGWEITCGDGTNKEKEELRKQTGINGLCILGLLPFFDLCMDINLDMMHVLKNIWQEHLLKVFRGTATPKKPKPPARGNKPMAKQREEAETHRVRLELYEEIIDVRNTLNLTPKIDTYASHLKLSIKQPLFFIPNPKPL
jgi:hypothetical protein